MPLTGLSPKEVIHEEMHRFKHGQLHSGSHHGPKVKNRKQAIAIALSESRRARADGGALMPVPDPPSFRDRLRNEQGDVEDRRGYLGIPEMSRLHSVMAGMGLPAGDGGNQSMQGSHIASDAGLHDIGRRHRAPGGGLAGFQGPMGAAMAAPDITMAAKMQAAGLGGLGQSATPSPTAPASQLMSGFGASGMNTAPAMSAAPSNAPTTMSPSPMANNASVSGAQQPDAGISKMAPWSAAAASPAIQATGQLNRFGSLANSGAAPGPGRDLGGGMIGAPNSKWMERSEARSMLHSGPISSIVPGRTDRHNVHVASGSYVMPADAVSHIGQSNTKAGQAILGRMFSQGPYGSAAPKMAHGSTMPRGPGKMAAIPAAHIPKFQSAGGGKDDRTGEPVPVVVAGGEFTIPPEAVAAVGGGDVKRGHRILDNWVMSLRKKHIATLKGLPPPVKS